jgi:hypothetical protein
MAVQVLPFFGALTAAGPLLPCSTARRTWTTRGFEVDVAGLEGDQLTPPQPPTPHELRVLLEHLAGSPGFRSS